VKDKIFGESFGIALYLLVSPFGFHAINRGKICGEHNFSASNRANDRVNRVTKRTVGRLLFHFTGSIAKSSPITQCKSNRRAGARQFRLALHRAPMVFLQDHNL
jgi:hypothetical protein